MMRSVRHWKVIAGITHHKFIELFVQLLIRGWHWSGAVDAKCSHSDDVAICHLSRLFWSLYGRTTLHATKAVLRRNQQSTIDQTFHLFHALTLDQPFFITENYCSVFIVPMLPNLFSCCYYNDIYSQSSYYVSFHQVMSMSISFVVSFVRRQCW